jgi:hypothetical protein
MNKSTWLAAALAVSAFAADHLLDEVAPKLPHTAALLLFISAVTVLAGAHANRVWAALLTRFPRPWLPVRPWQVRRWLAERPGAAILVAQPGIELRSGIVNRLSFTLTISRSFARASGPTRMLFAEAELVLRQGRRRMVLRPQEAGGLLALPLQPGGNDAIVLTFIDPACPRAIADAPNFYGDYTLELRGIRAEIGEKPSLAGVLPAARRAWAGSAVWSTAPLDAPDLQTAL